MKYEHRYLFKKNHIICKNGLLWIVFFCEFVALKWSLVELPILSCKDVFFKLGTKYS